MNPMISPVFCELNRHFCWGCTLTKSQFLVKSTSYLMLSSSCLSNHHISATSPETQALALRKNRWKSPSLPALALKPLQPGPNRPVVIRMTQSSSRWNTHGDDWGSPQFQEISMEGHNRTLIEVDCFFDLNRSWMSKYETSMENWEIQLIPSDAPRIWRVHTFILDQFCFMNCCWCIII